MLLESKENKERFKEFTTQAFPPNGDGGIVCAGALILRLKMMVINIGDLGLTNNNLGPFYSWHNL